MAERLQDRIRRRARELEKPGRKNRTMERFEAERGRSPLHKRRRPRPKRPARRRPSSPEVGTLATALTKSALREKASRGAVHREPESPVASMLEDMSGVLAEFRESEGRDPTTQDREFWTAYKKIIATRLGS